MFRAKNGLNGVVATVCHGEDVFKVSVFIGLDGFGDVSIVEGDYLMNAVIVYGGETTGDLQVFIWLNICF